MKTNLCPICGKQLGFRDNLFGATRISGGIKLCAECGGMLRVDTLRLPYLTLGEATALAKKGRENYEVFKAFKPTRQARANDFFLRVDDQKGLWYVCITKKPGNPPIYKKEALISYTLTENRQVILSHRRGHEPARSASPEYEGDDAYLGLRSLKVSLEIEGVEDPVSMELLSENHPLMLPGQYLYKAYLEEAGGFCELLSKILSE